MNKELKTFEELSERDRYVIAEFVYSFETDILVKSDAVNLINVLSQHECVSQDQAKVLVSRAMFLDFAIVDDLMTLLEENFSNETMKQIMNNYFSNP